MPLPLVALAATLVPEIVRIIAGDRAGTAAGHVADAVWNHSGRRQLKPERAKIRELEIARQMNCRGARERPAFDEAYPEALTDRAAQRDELSHKHPARRHQVRNAGGLRGAGGRVRRPEED